MSNILILGANGQIARLVTELLLKESSHQLTLYLRNPQRLSVIDPIRERIVDGDVNETNKLAQPMAGKDIVYANLGGVFEPQAASIVQSMKQTGVKRLIYVTGLGLYHEVPGEFDEWNKRTIGSEVMDDTRRAAKIIENSEVNYTIIRAAYMTNDNVIKYELTQKGKPFKGTIISRKSIADYILQLIADKDLDNYASVGIDQPGTEGDRPMYSLLRR